MASGERGEQPMGHKVYMESRLYFQISMLSFENLVFIKWSTQTSAKNMKYEPNFTKLASCGLELSRKRRYMLSAIAPPHVRPRPDPELPSYDLAG